MADRSMSPRKSYKDKNGSHPPSKGLGIRFDLERKIEFCSQLAQCGTPAAICRRIGVNHSTFRVHLNKDLDFRQMYAEAMLEFNDRLATEAYRRGVEGVPKAVYYKGDRVDKPGDVMEYSDRLLELLLKKNDPAFRDRSTVENLNANIDMGAMTLENLNPEQRQKLRELLAADQGAQLEPPADLP